MVPGVVPFAAPDLLNGARMRKVIERLLNLLAFLLTVERPVTADEIRRRVAGYDDSSLEAFRRKFERDKDLLRNIGIPLETTATDAWEIEAGYRIDPDAYRLPDPDLTDEERAALAVASRMVRLGAGAIGSEALLKLGGIGPGGGQEPVGADLGTAADRLGDLFAAVSERREVSFEYRDKPRVVQPYGLAHRRGHWYLVGKTDDGQRVFRVDRMGEVFVHEMPETFTRPVGFSVRNAFETQPWETGGDESITATVVFDPEMAWWAARTLHVDPPTDGPLEVQLGVTNVDAFVGWLLSFGESAVVTAPTDLRDQVISRIQAALS